jgi:hypothetical protein
MSWPRFGEDDIGAVGRKRCRSFVWQTGDWNTLESAKFYRCGLTFLSLVIAVTSVVLDSPDKKNLVYLMIAFLGRGAGMDILYTARSLLYTDSQRQETEMMDFVAFTNQIFGWLPPFIVTILNENYAKLRWGFSVISGFCILACFCTGFMGDYEFATL